MDTGGNTGGYPRYTGGTGLRPEGNPEAWQVPVLVPEATPDAQTPESIPEDTPSAYLQKRTDYFVVKKRAG